MTYWEFWYGKCKKMPNGSPDCCAACQICGGANWVPLGVKSFEEFLTYFQTHSKVTKKDE